MAQLFGFQITRAKDKGEQASFVLPDPESGATTTAGFYSEFLDIEGQTKSESDLIRRYRSTSEHPECDLAIEDIINESINIDVAYETNDAIETFDVTYRYQFFETNTTT